MYVARVGELTEHPDGSIDISYWTINFELDAPVTPEQTKACRQELIRLAKEADTYTYKDD